MWRSGTRCWGLASQFEHDSSSVPRNHLAPWSGSHLQHWFPCSNWAIGKDWAKRYKEWDRDRSFHPHHLYHLFCNRLFFRWRNQISRIVSLKDLRIIGFREGFPGKSSLANFVQGKRIRRKRSQRVTRDGRRSTIIICASSRHLL